MKYVLKSLWIAAAVVAVAACAKAESSDYTVTERISLDSWMKLYVDSPDLEKWDNGMYVQWLHHGDGDSLAEAGDWVRVNFNGMTLQKDIFYTRSEQTARLQGTFTRHTHYVPYFFYLNDPNNTTIDGIYDILLKMRVGDKVRIYLPSDLAYGSSGYSNDENVGYSGQFSLDGNVPVIIDELELIEMSTDPIVEERVGVEAFVAEQWNINPADSLLESYYFDLQTPFPFERDSISRDSTIKIYYTGKFLDGFVFDSNIDSVQQRVWGSIDNSGPLEFKMEDDSTSYVRGFTLALSKMCYGDRAKVVFTSNYGYDIQGKSAQYNSSSSSSSSSSDYYSMLNYYSYMNSMYGYGSSGYGYGSYGGYGSSYYNNYYNSYYYNQLYNSYSSSSSSDETTTTTVSTEILPFTPLIFELYIMPYDGSGDELDDTNSE